MMILEPNLVVFTLTILLVNCGAIVLLHFMQQLPAPHNITKRYFVYSFVFSLLSYISFISRLWLPLPLSVFATNLFYLLSGYSIYCGLRWRYEVPCVVYRKAYFVLHIVLFCALQVTLALYEDSGLLLLRTRLLAANLIFIFSLILMLLWRYKDPNHRGETVLFFAVVYTIISMVTLQFFYYLSTVPAYYMGWAFVVQITIVFALLGGFYSLFLNDLSLKYYDDAIRDGMTGLHNRQYFYNAIAQRQSENIAFNAICIVMCDLDKFKQINDHFGHAAGDAVIIAFAQTLAQHVRKQDLCARYGGEEFIVLLAETDLTKALAIAERMRHATTVIQLAAPFDAVRVTASFGVAELKNPSQLNALLPELIKAADAALYHAKAAGRNRVCAAAPF
jgi:diguanylate cyclase (GGDEF)-like protein